MPTLDHQRPRSGIAACLPLDATLSVEGRPQSGTGQSALLTGLNAAQLFGRHFGPWTPVKLRPLLAEHNLLKKTQDAGRSVAFANAYPEGYPEGVSTRRQAAPALSALSVGALTRHHHELRDGRAVASGIENTGWIHGLGFPEIPAITPERAGANLAFVSESAALTLFAHFDTDYAGHEGTLEAGVTALERVDRFLSGLVDAMAPETTLLVASDHGNIEECTGQHTRNPVLGMVVRKAGLPTIPPSVSSIMDVAPFATGLLGLDLS